MSETPSPLHGLRDTVPLALDYVIARALARIPADRYATASQFGQALQAVLIGATPMPSVDVMATTPPAIRPERPQVAGPTWGQVSWWIIFFAAVAITIWTWPPFFVDRSGREVGNLWVLTETKGTKADADGYMVTSEGLDTRRVTANSTSLVWPNVRSGQYTLQLLDVEQNCSVDGPTSQSVSVEAGQNAYITFVVVCS